MINQVIRVGNKKIFIQQEHGKARAIADCGVFPQIAVVNVPLTVEQANRLLVRHETRENIRDILPDTSRKLRELFVTGLTPAEWDAMFGQREPWRIYQAKGYDFMFEEIGFSEKDLDAADKEYFGLS